MSVNGILIHPDDNVMVVTAEVKEGDEITGPDVGTVKALTDIPKNHKAARSDIKAGGKVIKYGEVIGHAKQDIKQGEWIHTHNLVFEGSE